MEEVLRRVASKFICKGRMFPWNDPGTNAKTRKMPIASEHCLAEPWIRPRDSIHERLETGHHLGCAVSMSYIFSESVDSFGLYISSCGSLARIKGFLEVDDLRDNSRTLITSRVSST